MILNDFSEVAPFLYPALRKKIDWKAWVNRESWNKDTLIKFMNDCDFPIKDVKFEGNQEFLTYHSPGEGSYWIPMSKQGSGFNSLFGGLIEKVLKNDSV